MKRNWQRHVYGLPWQHEPKKLKIWQDNNQKGRFDLRYEHPFYCKHMLHKCFCCFSICTSFIWCISFLQHSCMLVKQEPESEYFFQNWILETLTTSLLIRSIATIIHQVTEPEVLHTSPGVQAVEMRLRRTNRHCRRHRTVLERDVIQGRDSVKHTKADLSKSDLEGLGDTSQLNCGLVPLGSLVVQSPPYDSVVWGSLDSKVHICSAHRYAWVIMPAGDEMDELPELLEWTVYCKSAASCDNAYACCTS